MRLIKFAIAALALVGWSAPLQAQTTLQDILSSGVLKVGTTGDWNPMTMKDPATNSYTGYDIDVMTALAKDLDVEIEFVPTDWKTLVSGVVSGKYHMTGSASISPARAKVAGYTDSYFSLATVPLTLTKNADKFKDWADLDKADVTVAATLGTTQEKQVKQFFPNAQYKIVEAPAREEAEHRGAQGNPCRWSAAHGRGGLGGAETRLCAEFEARRRGAARRGSDGRGVGACGQGRSRGKREPWAQGRPA